MILPLLLSSVFHSVPKMILQEYQTAGLWKKKMTRTKKDEKNKPIDSEAFESDSASLEVPDLSFPKKASVLSYGLH